MSNEMEISEELAHSFGDEWPGYNEGVECHDITCSHQKMPGLCTRRNVILRFIVDHGGIITARCKTKEATDE